MRDVLSLVDAPLDEIDENPAIAEAPTDPLHAIVTAAPARVKPSASSKVYTTTIRPADVDVRSLFVKPMQRIVGAAESAYNATCIDMHDSESHPDFDSHPTTPNVPASPKDAAGAQFETAEELHSLGNLTSLVVLMRRLERQWSRLKR